MCIRKKYRYLINNLSLSKQDNILVKLFLSFNIHFLPCFILVARSQGIAEQENWGANNLYISAFYIIEEVKYKEKGVWIKSLFLLLLGL